MRTELPKQVEDGRMRGGYYATSPNSGPVGKFRVRLGGGALFAVLLVDDGKLTGWEHVSVSMQTYSKRHGYRFAPLPTWDRMCLVKDWFWWPEETVIQFHPARSEYVDNAPVLHLWRPLAQEIALPPSILVGMKSSAGLPDGTQLVGR